MTTEEYWNRNINEWGKFYLGISHSGESLKGPAAFVAAYKASIGRYEAMLMKTRFEATMAFIRNSVTEGSVFADLGCGTGLFSLAALRQGANVIAVDFAETALTTTKRTIETRMPQCADRVRYLKLDLRTQQVPSSDVSIAVGLVPYIANIDQLFDNVVANTDSCFMTFVSETAISNRIRRLLPFLNVRDLNFHNAKVVDKNWHRCGFKVDSRLKLGTGFIDSASRI